MIAACDGPGEPLVGVGRWSWLVGLCVLVCVFGALLVGDARAATGGLTQKPGSAGCVSASDGGCTVASALGGAASVAVSPDRESVYVASALSDAVVVFDRAADGTLTQKPGTAGCISDTGSSGQCADGTALDNMQSVTVSPDGDSVYAAAVNSDAVVVFDRAADGTLTQKPGTAGCISDTGSGGQCADGAALNGVQSVAVSPDGGSVYGAAFNSGSVVVFDRAGDGTLTQKASIAGCTSETGSGGECVVGTALTGAFSVAVSPDGDSVYVGSTLSDAVVVFDRAGDGTLTQKPGTAGCISDTGSSGQCANAAALNGVRSVVVTPDGRSVYAAAVEGDAVVVFDRAADGTLTQKPGTAGCISGSTSGRCSVGTALKGAYSVAVSPDGDSVYAASLNSDAVVVFDRTSDGTLTQKPGVAGCISETGSGGQCADGTALEGGAFAVTVSPDGSSVYSAAAFSNAVAVFDRDPGAADLAIDLSDNPDPVGVGERITYTQSVTNAGPDDAPQTITTVALPATVRLVSASPGCTQTAATVTCTLGRITAGASAASAQLVVTATSAGQITSTATVSSARPDPAPANNTDSETTHISAPNTPPATPLPASPTPVPPSLTPVVPSPAAPAGLFAAKLELTLARVLGSRRTLDVLAPISARASGRLHVSFRAAGRTTRFNAAIDPAHRRARFQHTLTRAQARLGSGILTLDYPGDRDTQPQRIRLRAAPRSAQLHAGRPTIKNGRLHAHGTLTHRAHGVVRIQLLYQPAGAPTQTLQFTAHIKHGAYTLDAALSSDTLQGIAQRAGTVHAYSLFTGYLPRQLRGELQSHQVQPSR